MGTGDLTLRVLFVPGGSLDSFCRFRHIPGISPAACHLPPPDVHLQGSMHSLFPTKQLILAFLYLRLSLPRASISSKSSFRSRRRLMLLRAWYHWEGSTIDFLLASFFLLLFQHSSS
jgi:hypothetical protein